MTAESSLSTDTVARYGGASTQDLVRRDGRPVPKVFELESPQFLGDSDIAFDRYTSQAFFDREMATVWAKTWQWACREEQIPETGDYYVYEIGAFSVIVVRAADDTIKAFVNSCQHRGTKFRMGGSQGWLQELRCPFHGWTWSLDGSLKRIPCAWDVPNLGTRDFSLPQVKVGLWGGFVFIHLDPDAAPLEEYLAPLPEHFENFDLSNRYIALHIEKELYSNWKSSAEAFMENYHTQETHPQLILANADEATQYDIFSDMVSRFFTVFGVASSHLDKPLTEQEMVDRMLVGDRTLLKDDLIVREGESARIVMARVLRKVLGEVYDADLSRFTDTEMIDVSQYSLFPNMILFPQLSLPMIYRFRPIGMDPNRTLFELIFLRPRPEHRECPPPAEPIRLAENDSFTTVSGMDPILGHVYDQDTGNLRAQQEGFHAARKPGQTLLNYQEVRIRHLHQTLDRFMAEAGAGTQADRQRDTSRGDAS